MNANAQKLVDALRSGKYKQTQHTLARVVDGKIDCYCCLGVACEVFIENGNHLDRRQRNNKVEYGGRAVLLPVPVMIWLGFQFADGLCEYEYVSQRGGKSRMETSLADLNDDHGKTFSELADIIESNPKGLFA